MVRTVAIMLLLTFVAAHALQPPKTPPLRRSTPLHRIPCRLCPPMHDLAAPEVVWHMCCGVALGYAITDMLSNIYQMLARRQ